MKKGKCRSFQLHPESRTKDFWGAVFFMKRSFEEKTEYNKSVFVVLIFSLQVQRLMSYNLLFNL